MKSLTGYWISNVDNKYTNFGDILTPYIFSKFNINMIYDNINPQIYIFNKKIYRHKFEKVFSVMRR